MKEEKEIFFSSFYLFFHLSFVHYRMRALHRHDVRVPRIISDGSPLLCRRLSSQATKKIDFNLSTMRPVASHPRFCDRSFVRSLALPSLPSFFRSFVLETALDAFINLPFVQFFNSIVQEKTNNEYIFSSDRGTRLKNSFAG